MPWKPEIPRLLSATLDAPWITSPARTPKPLWQERFDLLEEVVQELKKEEEGVSSDE